jgi:hypothetical protein
VTVPRPYCTLLPLIPTSHLAAPKSWSARLASLCLPFPFPSPKLPPLHPKASPQQKVHSTAHAKNLHLHLHLHSKGPPQIFRTMLRFGFVTRARTDWTSHPKRVQLHAFNCLPSWMGNIYTLSSRHPSRFIFVDLLLEAPLTTVNRSLGPPPISDSCSPQKTNSL